MSQLEKMKLEDLINASKQYDTQKLDHQLYNGDLNAMLHMLDIPGETVYNMNEFTWLQLTKRLHQPFRDFNSSTMKWLFWHPELVSPTFKYLMKRFDANEPDTNWFIRSFSDNIRAILSPDYTPINNSLLLETIADSLPHEESHVSKESIVTPDYLVLKMILRDFNTNTGDYGIGLMVSNDEVGKNKLKFGGLIKRRSCDNSIIIPNRFAVFHRVNIFDKLLEIVKQLPELIEDTTNYIWKFEATRKVELTEINFLIETIAKKLQLSNELKEHMFTGTENYESLFGLINGVTHAAKFTNSELERAELEEYSAVFLDMVNANQVFEYVGR